jgi:hypothetical protein
MIFDVTCPSCGNIYLSEDAHVGKHLRCKCGFLVEIVRPQNLLDRSIQKPSQPDSAPPSRKQPVAQSPSPPTRNATKFRRNRVTGLMAVVFVVPVLVIVCWIAFTRSKDSSQDDTPKPSGNSAPSTNSRLGTYSPSDIAPAPTSVQPQWGVADEEPSVVTKQPTARRVIKLPDPRPKVYNSLPTGTRIGEDIGTGGHGKLTVENGTSDDAVIRLYDAADQPVRQFFVQSNGTAQIGAIPDGPYRLAFTTGLDWIESEESFRWQPEYFEFDRNFVYTEQKDSAGVEFDHVSVTLHPVLNGNLHRRSVTREQFLKGHLRVALQR